METVCQGQGQCLSHLAEGVETQLGQNVTSSIYFIWK